MAAYLREGERICWEGRPEPFPLLDRANGLRIALGWIAAAAAVTVLLAAYYIRNPAPTAGFCGAAVLAAAAVLATPVLEYRSLRRERYWITSQRAILQAGDGSFYCMELAELDEYGVVSGAAEVDCLFLGRSMFEEPQGRVRWRACHPKVDLRGGGDADRAQGMIFYCVRNADAAARLLEQWPRPRAGRPA